MNFRPYMPDDFTALCAVEEACFAPLVQFSRSYMKQLLARRRSAAWIAEEKGLVVGFAIIGWNGRRGSIVAYIETIEVLEKYRCQGAGAALLRFLEGSARGAEARAICLHVEAENRAAIHLYEAHGYRYVSREEDFYPEAKPALIFCKPLSISL